MTDAAARPTETASGRPADDPTSRFVVSGRCLGRRVRFNGITISRFANSRIVEDWSVTDTLALLRQLGPGRAILAGLRQWRQPRR